MSIHLVGGGWSVAARASVYGPFAREARLHAESRSRRSARVRVIQLYDRTVEDGVAKFEQFASILRTVDISSVAPLLIAEGDCLPPDVLESSDDVDGLLVAGGPTPAYLTALTPAAGAIRDLVASGVPYLGFSAGAGIASAVAIAGGWRCDELAIGREECAEGLDQLTTEPGLGLVDFAVDAHAAQWGNLTRAISAVVRGDVTQAVAIDEDTVCIVTDTAVQIAGTGQAWWVTGADAGVTVRTTAAHSRDGSFPRVPAGSARLSEAALRNDGSGR